MRAKYHVGCILVLITIFCFLRKSKIRTAKLRLGVGIEEEIQIGHVPLITSEHLKIECPTIPSLTKRIDSDSDNFANNNDAADLEPDRALS